MHKYLRDVDGLRGVDHFDNKILSCGYLGVDIFFAISGFVITNSITMEIAAGIFTVNRFLMRRAKRLLPALGAVVTVSIIATTLTSPNWSPLATGASALIGTSNILLWFSGLDYFSTFTEWNPLTHTWSLGVEEQFYLLFPFALLLVSGKRQATFLLLGTVALASLVAYLVLWNGHRMAVFYLTPFRLWELLAGALVSSAYRMWGSPFATAYQSLLKFGLLCALLRVLFSTELPEHFATILSVFGSSGVLYLAGIKSKQNLFLGNSILVFIGRISYSIYLWHWPIIVYSKLLLPLPAILPAYVVLTMGLSLISYYGIERPLRYRRWTYFRENFLVTYSCYALVSAVVIAIIWVNKPVLFLGSKQMLEAQFLKADACHIPDNNGLTSCLQADARGRRTIWLIGDSHAGNFLISLRGAAEWLDVGLQSLTGRGLFLSLTNQCTLSGCPEGSSADLAARLKAVSRPGDVVVISFWRERFRSDAPASERFQKNFEKFIGQLNLINLNVVLVEDIPKVCLGDREYLQSVFWPAACSVSATYSRRERAVLSTIYKDIAARQRVTILDPHDKFCSDPLGNGDLQCGNSVGNEWLYLDQSPHLTYQASASLAGFFVEGLGDRLIKAPSKLPFSGLSEPDSKDN